LFGKQTLIDILIGESPCGDFCPLCKTAETCGYCAIVKTTAVYQCRSTPWLKILDVKDKKGRRCNVRSNYHGRDERGREEVR